MTEDIIKKLVIEANLENPSLICEPTYLTKLYKILKPKILSNDFDDIWKEHHLSILLSVGMERNSTTYEYCKEDDPYCEAKLEYLKNVYQPQQRTEDWYRFRYNHLTASNAWKAFGTQSSQNELIYEKCQPMITEKYKPSLNESPMTWGHKYEPLTVKVYEEINKTTISDFGCIEHKTYPFLAASPDGIVTGNNNYGRMIEIKNVVSREINGIPKKDYYIQMQLQMEVCDLDECDFVETKFTEYSSEEEYIQDVSENKKGVMCVFIKNNESFYYEYMPLNYDGTYTEWINNIQETVSSSEMVWFRNIFWKLDVYSCVLVKRKREWFNNAISTLKSIWKTIEDERITNEYVSRGPKKRIIVKKLGTEEEERKKELDSLFEFATG